MAFLKVALLAAPIMICGCPVLGIKMMVGSDCIPITGQPQIIIGAANKTTFRKAIEEVLLKE